RQPVDDRRDGVGRVGCHARRVCHGTVPAPLRGLATRYCRSGNSLSPQGLYGRPAPVSCVNIRSDLGKPPVTDAPRPTEQDSNGSKRARMNESSTDSIDLAQLRESGHTQAWQPSASQERRVAGAGEIEANVILIAHPENRTLGTRFRLRPGSVIEIGRSPTSEISFPEVLSISRAHARLEHQGSNVVIEDLGSTNGT